MTSVGVNLGRVNYWSAQHPFIDRWKTSGNWTVTAAKGQTAGALTLDDQGYPTGMPTGAKEIYAVVGLDDSALSMTDRYVFTYEGTGNFRFTNAKVISKEPGKIVLEYTGSSSMQVNITSMDGKDPIHDIHLVREDQVPLFEKGEVFNPAFIDKASDWGLLRFMDWGNTNGSDVQTWDDRATVDKASWASTTKGGVPLEIMVQLSNKLGTDMWYSIPAKADDEFVQKTMEYIRDNLDPSLKVHIEYSNEMWNWGFSQSKYAMQEGNKLWGTDVNGDGVIDVNNPNEHVRTGWLQYYGYRSAQVADIAGKVFGDQAEDRLVREISTQTGSTMADDAVQEGIAKAGLGDIGDLFDGWAITGYFSLSKVPEATILEWARSGAKGKDAAFEALGLTGDGAIQDMFARFERYAQLADKNGMRLDIYEAGSHFVAASYSGANQKELEAFFKTLIQDSRMADIYKLSTQMFSMVGGDLMTPFNDVAATGKYGYWGLLDSIYDEKTDRYKAYLQALEGGKEGYYKASNVSVGGVAEGTVMSDNLTGSKGADKISGLAGNDKISGLAGDDTLDGGTSNDTLLGGAGNDSLIGGVGNDLLDGGEGIDIMVGGAGDDIYVIDDAKDQVVELAKEGYDIVQASVSYTLSDEIEALVYTGTGDFVGTGNALANSITGGAGNDTLNGGGGRDTLIGGAGNDTYIVGERSVVITEDANGGIDRVVTSLAAFTLGDNIEELIYSGSGYFAGTGNELANVMSGGSGSSRLLGMGGNDSLIGGDEGDVLDGGTGADTMAGGLGSDRYFVDNANDVVIEAADAGIDMVESVISYTLGANVENLKLAGTAAISGTGNELDNRLIGNDAANRLSGGLGDDRLEGGKGNDVLEGGAGDDVLMGDAGDDTMIGGDGLDIYHVDSAKDRVIELADGGYDRVIATVSYVLPSEVEALFLQGTARVGTGNELNNDIRDTSDGKSTVTLYGMAGADNLRGGDGANKLYGGADNDILSGGAGNDTLYGGAGRDVLTGGKGADRFVFEKDALGDLKSIDSITDFSRAEGDKIDVSLIDARVGGRDDAFKFIGTGAFSGSGGELRIQASAGVYTVSVDIDGDKFSDLSFKVTSATELKATDFIL